MSENKLFQVIEFDADLHKKFIVDSWLKSSHDSFPACLIEQELYNANFLPWCVTLLSRALVLVAVNTEDHDHLCGWCCCSDGRIHYVYVKYALRGFGVARGLLREAERISGKLATFTSLPNNQNVLKALARYGLKYDPYAARDL